MIQEHHVIGNGESRKDLNVNELDGTTYGCNAIYRDYYTDYLFNKDKPIQHEILRHNFRQAVFDLNCGHVKVKAEEDVEDDDPFVFVEVVAFVIAVNILIVLEFLRIAKA